MGTIARDIRNLLLLGALIAGVSSCKGLIDHNDNEICRYNVALLYHYNRENESRENLLERYVGSLTEYVFDDGGILYAVRTPSRDECTGAWVSEFDLPEGRYSVITWGNLGTTCRTDNARIGITRREDMLLTLDNPCPQYAGYHDNSDRLFYGYRTFSVRPGCQSRIRIDMLHAHLALKYKVTWSGTQPAQGGDYQMRMRGNPSEYSFMTEFISRNEVCREHDPAIDDEYLGICDETIHYIPRVLQSNALHHRVNTLINVDKAVEGEIVAFRLRNDTPAILSLHEITQTRSYGERQVLKDFNLSSYFSHHQIDLDRTLRQEYGLEFVIGDDGTVTVLPMEFSDWEEGGPL